MYPLDFEDEKDFRDLRALLGGAEYTTARVCERMQIPTIYNFKSIVEGREERIGIEDKLDLLVRLFMDAEPVPWSALAEHLSEFEADMVRRLGLVTGHDQERCRATVLLYPTEGLWITSDLDHAPLEQTSPPQLADDVVYPAITRNTQHFMSSLPRTPCTKLLELCSGTGIAALVGASLAEHAWAVDITERSTQCAAFNARLNQIENITPLQGDLYEPVAGQVFDRIVAHPPYIPAEKLEFIYRDGGVDGEQITRRIVSELPDHLAPGGRFHATCMVTDRYQKPFETRVRDWLGAKQDEFDVLVVEMGTMHPTEHYTKEAIRGRMEFDLVARRHKVFSELEIVDLLYCSFVLQKKQKLRSVFTARTQRGPRTTGKDFEWRLEWETAQVANGGPPSLLDQRLTASPRVRLMVVYEMEDLTWTPSEYNLGSESPFISKASCPAWGAQLIQQCDGTRTTREHFEDLKKAGALPEDAPEEEFEELVRTLITAGFIQIEPFMLPFPTDGVQRLTVQELFRDDNPGELR